MKKIFYLMLLLFGIIGCARNIYEDDILKTQYNTGHKQGYIDGYYEGFIEGGKNK